MKRVLALILCLVLCLSLLPAAAAEDIVIIDTEEDPITIIEPKAPAEPEIAPAPAERNDFGEVAEGKCGDDMTWTLYDNGQLLIAGTGEMWGFPDEEPDYEAYADQVIFLDVREGVTSIGSWAFDENYVNLTKVAFPSTLKEIGNASFQGSGLVEVSFPEALETIVGWAFEDCGALKRIAFHGNAPDLNFSCFNGVTATVLYPADNQSWTAAKIQDYYSNHHINGSAENPASGTLNWKPVQFCGDFAYWMLSGGTLTISGTGSAWFAEDETSLFLPYYNQIEKAVVEEGITQLGNYIFQGLTKLKTVSLPETLRRIMSGAFAESGLTLVTIPASVTEIWYEAFRDCSSLKTVRFLGHAPEILMGCFEGVTATVYYPGDDKTWTNDKIQDYYDSCQIVGDPGEDHLTWVAVTAPKITTQPKSQSAATDATATFSVAASGGDLSYQWQYKKSASDSWHNSGLSSAKTATLKIKATNSVNGYQYHCVVTNAAGTTTSSAATLTVGTKPTITTQPKSVTAPKDTTVKFTVTATGATSYQWQYKKPASDTWYVSGSTGCKTAELTLTATEARSGFRFRCKVTNAAGSTYSDEVTLTVVTKPTISTQPKSVTAAAGSTASFTVSASGGGLSYQWQYKKNASDSWHNSSLSSAKTATLKIKATSSVDGYQYRCKVTNGAGSVYTEPATLTVNTGITAQPQSVTASVGETVSFTVEAEGATSYQWQCRTSASGSWFNSGLSTAKEPTLKIKATASVNGYQYRCKITNASGTVYTDVATLTVE